VTTLLYSGNIGIGQDIGTSVWLPER